MHWERFMYFHSYPNHDNCFEWIYLMVDVIYLWQGDIMEVGRLNAHRIVFCLLENL